MASHNHRKINNADTDKDLNERAEFTADEEAARNDPTFGIGEIQTSQYGTGNHRPGQSHQVPATMREDHGDEDDDFWYGSGNG